MIRPPNWPQIQLKIIMLGSDRAVSQSPWPAPRRSVRAWLVDHSRVAAESLGYISGRLGTSLLVWLLIGIALALPAGLYLLQKNLATLDGDWQGRPGLSVYFAPGTPTAEVYETVEATAQVPQVQRVWHITPEEALAEFQSFSGLTDALGVLSENPLPNSLRVTLRADADLIDLQDLSRILSERESIDEVVIEKTWLERLTALSLLVNRLGVILGLMFAVGALLVTATSVRLAIESRLDELRVQQLVGAAPGFIRRPFLYFGLLYGLGGGLVALMLLSGVLIALEVPIATLVGSYGGTLNIAGFDPIFLVGMLAVGGTLGLFGALLASYQRLTKVEIA